MLVIDLGDGGRPGGDGRIDQTRELVFTQWDPAAQSDMEALRTVFDTNHDGKLDAHDSRFSEFRIWRDANQNGIVDAGELKTLTELGITSIALTPTGGETRLADGSVIHGHSAVSWADGHTTTAADATFSFDAAGVKMVITSTGLRLEQEQGGSSNYFIGHGDASLVDSLGHQGYAGATINTADGGKIIAGYFADGRIDQASWYDSHGALTRTVDGDASGRIVDVTFDSHGTPILIRSTDAAGNLDLSIVAEAGGSFLKTVADATGQLTQHYTATGRIDVVTHSVATPPTQPGGAPGWRIDRREIDAADGSKMVTLYDASGAFTERHYLANGRNDTTLFHSGHADDAFIGGEGYDTAMFSGNRADYTINVDATSGAFFITDQRAGAPDGADRLSAVEAFAFADTTVIAASFHNAAPTDALLTGGSVAENAAAGTVVGTVAGIDPDIGGMLTYALLDGAGGRFRIDAASGRITVAADAGLDYESATAHKINVHVRDQDGLSFDKAFTIAVGDVNEAPVDINLAGGTVAENAAAGTVVGTAFGIDPDAGATFTYSLVDNAGGRFAIDAASGRVSVGKGAGLDFESAPGHDITVRATDQGGLSFDKRITIAVADANEAPTGAILSGGRVAENAARGTLVGQVVGSDPDAGARLSYALLDDAGGRFTIDAATGNVSVANGQLLDYEAATAHAILVRVTDQGGLSFDKAFRVGLINVNESPPVAATLSGGSVAENAAAGTLVGTVSGYDPDAESVLSYALVDDAGGRFAIDAATGRIVVANGGSLDYEAAASHPIVVRVKDQDGLAFDKSFSIGVTDVNEAPTGLTLAGGSVAENSAAGTIVGRVTGVDPDHGASLAYALVDNAAGRFVIDAATGVIAVAAGAVLDYEAATAHVVTVRVTDQAGLFVDKAVSLAVSNVNEAPTGIALNGAAVAENAANGTLVGTAAGIDPDAASQFRYSLADDAGGRFAIDVKTGVISVANGALLDYESATSHAITIHVSDEAGLSFSKGFTIAVGDVGGMTLTGTTGNDNLTGTPEGDQIQGLDGTDVLHGGAGNDRLDGGAGNDVLYGEDGNDTLIAGTAPGRDDLFGGKGDDIYIVDTTNAFVTENAGEGNDTVMTSLASYSASASIESLVGTAKTGQSLTGSAGDTSIVGSSGNDTLVGRNGNDGLAGGAGYDALTGGGGDDTFFFAQGFGHDTIADFHAGAGSQDVIAFQQGVFADLNAVLSAATQVGADVVIHADAADTITLKNVALANLHADDFRFLH